MKNQRKIIHHPAAYWQEHINNWQQSQLSQKQYCERNNLGLSTFQKWKKKLHPSLATTKPKQKSLPEPESFIEIPAQSFEPQSDPHWDIELSLGNDITLRLRHCS